MVSWQRWALAGVTPAPTTPTVVRSIARNARPALLTRLGPVRSAPPSDTTRTAIARPPARLTGIALLGEFDPSPPPIARDCWSEAASRRRCDQSQPVVGCA